jgi:hypothetical protein
LKPDGYLPAQARGSDAGEENSMKAPRPFLIVLLLAFALAPGKILAASDVHVRGAEFGIFKNSAAVAKFTRSRTVPLKVGQAYGWRIFLDTRKTTVHFREEFELPLPPETWGKPQGQTVSRDYKTSVLERDVPVEGGLIENMWSVAPGDPCGKHAIRVFIDRSLAATFQFDVECASI